MSVRKYRLSRKPQKPTIRFSLRHNVLTFWHRVIGTLLLEIDLLNARYDDLVRMVRIQDGDFGLLRCICLFRIHDI